MASLAIMHFRYKHHKSWNCEKSFDRQEDLQEWLDHERKVGNPVKQTGPNEDTVTVDY